MQFHVNGYRPGDPTIADPVEALPPPAPERSLPGDVDVLIVGSGPTGLTLAAQLVAFPDLTVCVAEAKPGPLRLGQADGIACRTMEMFQAFGFADRVANEAYWVNETVFWKPDPEAPQHIRRSDRIQDVEDGLSEMPHVILNQARVHDLYLELMRRAQAGSCPTTAVGWSTSSFPRPRGIRCGARSNAPTSRARSRPSVRGTWWGATAPAAGFAGRSVESWWAMSRTRPGV